LTVKTFISDTACDVPELHTYVSLTGDRSLQDSIEFICRELSSMWSQTGIIDDIPVAPVILRPILRAVLTLLPVVAHKGYGIQVLYNPLYSYPAAVRLYSEKSSLDVRYLFTLDHSRRRLRCRAVVQFAGIYVNLDLYENAQKKPMQFRDVCKLLMQAGADREDLVLLGLVARFLSSYFPCEVLIRCARCWETSICTDC